MAVSGSHFGPYQILSSLGAGAMGQVYRARDPRLGRDVAIKILQPYRSTDPDAVARLVREARVVASLAHPSILTIHDVGEEAGQFYIVTELVEGETLRAALARGSMPWRRVLDIAGSIAAGLAAAHGKSIVHRDIKPENIICAEDGAVKILDFGVAKFLSPSDAVTMAGPGAAAVTQAGAAVGTIAYMSPEQLEGREADHRADQFSFGVMLYEIVTGERPFRGATASETAAAILRDEPSSLNSLRPDVPTAFARIVSRCLAKNPHGRYASTADLALALEDVRADAGPSTAAARGPVGAASRRRASWVAGAAAAAVVAVAAIAWVGRDWSPTVTVAPALVGDQVVAVLPFSTIGDGESYLADGISESVTRELGRVQHTRVIASNSAFAYRDRTEGFKEIGRALNAGLLVRGSVQRAGGRVRINASLVDAANDTTVWSDRYDRDALDILAVQDEIAWQVASKLAAATKREAPDRPSPALGTTPQAYDAYLRGLSHVRGRSGITDTRKGLAAGIQEFERAVQLDGNFALARASLASAYTQRFFYDATDPAFEQKAFLEIEKALAINDDLPEAYLARAQAVWNVRNGFQHERAIADLKRAIANNPSLAEGFVELGKVYYHIGLLDKSIAANEQALRLDPLATVAARRRLLALIDARKTDLVRDELDRRPRWLAPSIRAAALLSLGDVGGAQQAIDDMAAAGGRDTGFGRMEISDLAVQATVFARLGNRSGAERALRAAIPRAVNPTGLSDIHHAQFDIGRTLLLLGRTDEAVLWLTKAADEGYPSYPRFSTEPDLGSLKGHPGFILLLQRLRKDYERWHSTL